jgi:hypothetical protein
MRRFQLAALIAASAAASAAAAQPAQPAGHVLWSIGQVERVAADGAVKPLAKGDAVYEGDVIRSAASAQAQLVMKDEALLAVRAESSVRLAKYSYSGHEDGSERAVIELVKGGLRSVTGAIGRTNKDNYQLKNDMAVIGIRGTDHESFANGEGTFNRVTLGGTYLQAGGGRLELAPGETGFVAPHAEAAPIRLAHAPDFMHLAALRGGYSGPTPRGRVASDERRLERGSVAASGPTPAAGLSNVPASSFAARALPAGTPALPALGEGRVHGHGNRDVGVPGHGRGPNK